MIEERLQKIEAQLSQAGNLPAATRTELLGLLNDLREEIAALPESRSDDAHSITRFVDASAHEATRADKKPLLLGAALSGLTNTVEEFEVTHPRLAETLNRIAVTLSHMGM
jgi:hypothetical protein